FDSFLGQMGPAAKTPSDGQFRGENRQWRRRPHASDAVGEMFAILLLEKFQEQITIPPRLRQKNKAVLVSTLMNLSRGERFPRPKIPPEEAATPDAPIIDSQQLATKE